MNEFKFFQPAFYLISCLAKLLPLKGKLKITIETENLADLIMLEQGLLEEFPDVLPGVPPTHTGRRAHGELYGIAFKLQAPFCPTCGRMH